MSSLVSQIDAATHDPAICAALCRRLEETLQGREMRFMEVCGTHTVSIFQSGLRSILPKNVKHLSGPGCPVCVTHEAEIALLLELAANKNIIIATFGDLLRVPGPNGQSLKHAKANGARVEIVYSPLDAISLAEANADYEIVFPGIGFETTAPAVAGSILAASQKNIANFSVLSLHKLVPPALKAILAEDGALMDAFLLPGHVAMITGLAPFEFLATDFFKPSVVGGFEPSDILLALSGMAGQLVSGQIHVANAYQRAVDSSGNARARSLLGLVFTPQTALWRGLGSIPQSGLGIAPDFAAFDAMAKLGLEIPDTPEQRGCRCGEVLRGRITPPECPMFGKKCSPATPVGPCMVSTEGSCAAWHKYGGA